MILPYVIALWTCAYAWQNSLMIKISQELVKSGNLTLVWTHQPKPNSVHSPRDAIVIAVTDFSLVANFSVQLDQPLHLRVELG